MKKKRAMIRKYAAAAVVMLLLAGAPAGSSARTTAEDAAVEKTLSSMSLEEKAGQFIMTDLFTLEQKGNSASVVRNLHIGSVLLYSNEMVTVQSTVSLIDRLQKAAGSMPLLVAIDQEGGRITRLPGGVTMPGNMALGAVGDPEDAETAARIIGEELAACGINVDLAPVLDVISGPEDPGIGTRSFGSDPYLVSSLGSAFIKGLHASGVAASAKHFPGLGRAAEDTHLDLPVIPEALEELEASDLLPFKTAVKEGVDMLMTAHAAYTGIDPTRVDTNSRSGKVNLPATLSRRILTDLVRTRLGFDGIIITDAMNMRAITTYFGPVEDAFLKAVKAGADIVIVESDPAACLQKLIDAVKSGEIKMSRIDETVRRILRMKLERGLLKVSGGRLAPAGYVTLSLNDKQKRAAGAVGSAGHRATEKTLTEKAVTLVKNGDDALPWKLNARDSLVYFVPSGDAAAACKKAFDAIYAGRGDKPASIRAIIYEGKSKPDTEDLNAARRAGYVLLFTYSSSADTRDPARYAKAAFASAMAAYAQKNAAAFAAVALGDPYDITFMPDIKSYVAVYGTYYGSGAEAGIKAVLGLIGFRGKLPVALP